MSNSRNLTLPWISVFGVYHYGITILVLCAAISVWPDQRMSDVSRERAGLRPANSDFFKESESASSSSDACNDVSLLWMTLKLSMGQHLVLFVALMGAAGACVHSTTSFTTYAGNRKLMWEWIWWYLLRPPLGAVLGLGIYIIFRAGFLTASNDATAAINLHGIATMSFLGGLFSKQATDKFSEAFDLIFPRKTADPRADKISDPKIDSTVPSDIPAGSSVSEPIEVRGSSFQTGCHVHVNSSRRETEFMDEEKLKFHLVEMDVTDEGELDLVVVNPAPDNRSSQVFKFKVLPPGDAEPAAPNGGEPAGEEPQGEEPTGDASSVGND